MLSTPHSPPKTPAKQAVAPGNHGLTPAASRTPLPDGQLKQGQVEQSLLKQIQKEEPILKLKENSSQQVQVPSSNPQRSQSDTGYDEQDEENPDSDDRIGEPGEVPSDNLNEVADDEHHRGDEAVADANIDLVPMDWMAFEREYIAALKDADEVENRLLTEFESVSTAFSAWAEASGGHDNHRAVKRLKTRARFVQLSELELEKKRHHYVEVVDAFKKALALLSA